MGQAVLRLLQFRDQLSPGDQVRIIIIIRDNMERITI